MKAPYNEHGVEHVHSKNVPAAEAAEMAAHLDAMKGTNVDHADSKVFNPAVSQRQFRAMKAAESGHSTLGIPASVGSEFTSFAKGKPGSVKSLPKSKHK